MPRFRGEGRQRRQHRRGSHTARTETRGRDGARGDGYDQRGESTTRAEAGSVAAAAARASRTRPARRLLEGIGTPAPAPFKPDPFQLAALAAVEHEDVLVTAPTGSGKTWIAREEIRRLLTEGRRVWYTSPLKALTNSKYHEFAQEFGASMVGVLTGDRKENADAPVVVGTTEVYRNQLFDAMREGRDLRADMVVMDEAHYLADEERGHVWEEAIILTPPRVRLLLLSATVGNAQEFAAWIEEVRGVRCGVVSRPGARPVPLRAAFLYPDGQLAPLYDEQQRFNLEIAQFLAHASAQRQTARWGGGQRREPRGTSKMHMPEMPPATLLAALRAYDLLPAIVFLPTRRRCDEAAAEAALGLQQRSNDARREARRDFLREFVEAHPEVRKHRHTDTIVRGGVAAHHAGHLPAWKLVIENLMSRGLLDAIFATATVAAGVDFPARTVVLTNVDARTGHGWRMLTASELQQMTGRAGRRSRDNVGFVVAAPGLHQDPQRLAALLQAPPDPLESQFRATYTTLLNLLDAYGDFAHVREIAARSFAYRETVERVARLERERDECAMRIERTMRETGCQWPLAVALGFERLMSARERLYGDAPQTRAEVFLGWLDKAVVPGRVVGIGRSGKRLVFVMERREGNLAGVREDGRRASLALERVGRVYEEIYPLTENARDAAFADVRAGRAVTLREPRLREARADVDEAAALINKLVDELLHTDMPSMADDTARTRCEQTLWTVVPDAATFQRMERRIAALLAEVWQPFEQRARVLAHFGYLAYAAERVTERGRWLADLRLDRPLLVGEAIERGLFARLDPPRAAGLVAALAADAERDYGELPLDDNLVTALAKFEQTAYDVAGVEWRHEIEPVEQLNFSAAAAAARWAQGATWTTLVRETRAEEGDLFRLLSRTGESLLQIAGLGARHAQAAEVARRGAEAILREPVRTDEIF
jgi:ATP-dependent RNA helicase HelY